MIPHFQFVLSEFSAARAERHQYGMAIYVNDHPLRVIPSTLLNLVREKAVTSSQKRQPTKEKGLGVSCPGAQCQLVFICVSVGRADPAHLWGTSFKVMATEQQCAPYTVSLPFPKPTVL